ncbi:MAG: hybrid sensor histidine kinase/response regulator [Tardiphaga sp.]|nr:hybrid sensor histidine kinase/response regulator [Tardiphaga sp.]
MAKLPRASRSSRPRKSNSRKSTQPAMVETALAAFAHEVRTPLTGILAISDLLATSDLGERERRWVDTIKAGAEHLADLATLFVDAARSHSASGLPIRDDVFDLRALVLKAGDSLAGRAAAKGLASKIQIAKTLPMHVTGDAIRLRAALENLIDNAVKFTPSGRVSFKVSRTQDAKGWLEIAFAVADSGIGLTLPEIKRLFKPFSQANVSIASRFGGAGLGLSSVRQLARAMGGDIKVEPRRGGGATFLLTVKVRPAPTPETITDAGDGVSAARQPLKILSVEDNPFGRVVLNTILTELGHQTEFIGRGEAAAARIKDGAFDAVLMDMVLPGINGVETIRQIRALKRPWRSIPIVGVSGRSDDEAIARAAGAGAFVVKPVSPRALEAALLEARRLSAVAT